MKAVILAGGLGTRLSEETSLRPKPMVEVGGRPILWHIMKIYSSHGINDFVICCGYKGFVIKEYFMNYLLHRSDVTIDVKNNSMDIHQNTAEPWKVTLVDTGDSSGTGGRLRRVKEYLDDETFCFTYGDGVSDVNVTEMLEFHKAQNTLATLTAVQPPGRYGAFRLSQEDDRILNFREKPKGDGAWINGGFFALEPKAIDYIEDDSVFWEEDPLSKIAEDGELAAYKHRGYWQSMDTLRDKNVLEGLWAKNEAPWKTWTE